MTKLALGPDGSIFVTGRADDEGTRKTGDTIPAL